MSTPRTGQRTLRAKSPTDVLAIVPRVLGFHPEESIVLLSLGPRSGCFGARVDLPDDPEDIAAAVQPVLEVVRRDRVDRALLVVYTDDAALAQTAATTVRAGLAEAGTALVEAIRADGRRWFSLSGCTRPCCPPEGTPYDISNHPFLVEAVFEGRVTLPSRSALAESLVGTDVAATAAVQAAAEAAASRMKAAARSVRGVPAPEQARRHLVQEGQWVQERIRRFLADRQPLEHAEVGRLLVIVQSLEARDVAWAEMNRDNASVHVDLWRDVVRRAPVELMAPAAALLGFAAWLDGDGALAWCAVDRAQRSQPGYGLAGLLGQALAGGVPPSSWAPLGPETLTLFAG